MTIQSAHEIISELYRQEGEVKRLDTEALFFVTAVFNAWSGKMSEELESFGLGDDDKIITLQKRVAPKELLQPFRNLRAYVYNSMDKVAARFYAIGDNTWVVTAENLERVRDILSSAQDDFATALQSFRLNYDLEVERFFEGKQFEPQLRKSKLSVDDVLDKFKFSHSIFQLSATGTSPNLTNDTVFESFVDSFAQQALNIYDALKKRQKKDMLLAKSVEPFFELLDKARSFAFVSPHAEAIANYLEKKLAAYKQGETITDATLLMDTYTIALTMASRDSLLRFGDFVMSQEGFKTEDKAIDLPPEWLELMGPDTSEEPPAVLLPQIPALAVTCATAQDNAQALSDFFISQEEALFDVAALPCLD